MLVTRINSETMIVGILAVLFALAGAFAVKQYLREEAAPEPPADLARAPGDQGRIRATLAGIASVPAAGS